jgi:DNA repair protein SbcD/Mre11
MSLPAWEDNPAMLRILHFADAHIDMANYGRHDPITGLPLRVLDFLKSLDTIVEAAITEKVDLVLFAGDAYKDRNPAPTFQREWDTRMARLSQAGIPTLLLIGNHDISPVSGRAHAMQELTTLNIPYLRVLEKPEFLGPDELWDLPLQVIALPWVPRSGMIAALGLSTADPAQIYAELESRLTALVEHWLELADPDLPIVLTAHGSVQGAKYGGERTVMLGNDLVLPGSLVRNPGLDYVALGHIHRPQNLNEGLHPPVIYPGSIERVDFGEAADDKFYILASVERGRTIVEWRKLAGIRPFFDRSIELVSDQNVNDLLKAALPSPTRLKDAIVRLVVDYPRQWEMLIDEATLRAYAAPAFEFHLVKRPRFEVRARISADRPISSYTSLDLLDIYWKTNHLSRDDSDSLQKLAEAIINSKDEG